MPHRHIRVQFVSLICYESKILFTLVQRNITLTVEYNFYRRFQLNNNYGKKSACPTKKLSVKINFTGGFSNKTVYRNHVFLEAVLLRNC